MAKKLGWLSQSLWGEWADRDAINRNADDLENVESNVDVLRAQVQRQGAEIVKLRAMIMGVVEILHAKAPFDDAELQSAIQAAHAELTTPPPAPRAHATAAGPPVICTKCMRTVPAAATNITGQGLVCDNCF